MEVPQPALVCDDLDSCKEPGLGVGKGISPSQLLRLTLGLCDTWRKYSAIVIRNVRVDLVTCLGLVWLVWFLL